MVGLAVRSRALGTQVRVCAPLDFAELLARVGVPLVPIGQPVRPPVTGATPPSGADLPPRAAELVAARFDTVAAAAEGCDALVATGVIGSSRRERWPRSRGSPGSRWTSATSHPAPLRARAVAEPHRAHTGRLGGRA